MKTYRIVKTENGQREILMSGLQGEDDNYKFRPNFELKVIRCQRATYYNENCTDVVDWCFNVTETPSNGSKVLVNYSIECE